MKNSFLNRTRIIVFISNSVIISLVLIIGKNDIMSTFFLIICICFLFINIVYIYLLYNPYSYIKIKRETPEENMYYFLYVSSNKIELSFIIINKLQEHYEYCSMCDLCKRYSNYLKINSKTIKFIDSETEKLLNETEVNNDNIIVNRNKLPFSFLNILILICKIFLNKNN